MAELRVLSGRRGQFVCPWCGATFAARGDDSGALNPGNLPAAPHTARDLATHFRLSPECSANRGVNNPTQSKYDVRDAEIPELRLPDTEDRDA